MSPFHSCLLIKKNSWKNRGPNLIEEEKKIMIRFCLRRFYCWLGISVDCCLANKYKKNTKKRCVSLKAALTDCLSLRTREHVIVWWLIQEIVDPEKAHGTICAKSKQNKELNVNWSPSQCPNTENQYLNMSIALSEMNEGANTVSTLYMKIRKFVKYVGY